MIFTPRLLAVISGGIALPVALARPAYASGFEAQIYENGTVIATAGTDYTRTTLDVCDLGKDNRLTFRAHWTASLRLTGTLSPRHGQCATSQMHFGATFHTVRLCEVFFGAERRCETSR